MLGMQSLREREDDAAYARLTAALAADPNIAEAWNGLAELAFRRGEYAKVHECAEKAISLDLYDREANFLDGSAYFAEGDLATARDRLGVATFSGGYRAAAFALIARSYLKEGNTAFALEAAEDALRCEGLQLDALLVKAIALRGQTGQRAFVEEQLARLPLAHALRYELEGIDGLGRFVVNELAAQTYIEIGSWYEETGLVEDAKAFFRAALPDTEAEIRLAYLEGREPVLTGPIAGVYPFRRESLPALEAAVKASTAWKAKYLLAVLKAFFRRREEALALLESCGEAPDEAVFYIYRARLEKGACREADLMRAKKISDGWRIGRDLIELYEAEGNLEKMLAMATEYLGRYPLKNPIQIAYARSLTKLGRHREAMAFLEGVRILPSEHRDSATEIWHDCQKALGLPLTWPENLGRGEPYHDGEWRQKG